MKEPLVSFFRKIQTNLQKELYRNEESVRAQIVYPILTRLGWDQEDPRAVRPEHSVSFSGGEKGRVDLALFSRPEDLYAQNQASVYIEVKSIGGIHKARDQLFEYFKNAPPGLKALATDGQTWRLYAFFKAPPDNLVWECDFLKDEDVYGEQADEFVRFLSVDSARQGRIDEAVNERLQENAKLRGLVSGSGSFVDKNHYKVRILLPGYEANPKGNYVPQKPSFVPHVPSPSFPPVPPSGAGKQQEAVTKGKNPKAIFCLYHGRRRIEGTKAADVFAEGVEILLRQKLTKENVTSFNQALQGTFKFKSFLWVEGTQDPPSYVMTSLRTLKLPVGSYTLSTHSGSGQKRDHFLELCHFLDVSCSDREADIGQREWCCFLNEAEQAKNFSPSASPWPTSHASFGQSGSYNRPPDSVQGAIKSNNKLAFFLYRHGRRVLEGTTVADVFAKGVEILLTQKLTEEKGAGFNRALQGESKLKKYFWVEGTRAPPPYVAASALYTFRLPVGSYTLSTHSSSGQKLEQFLELCRLLGVSYSGREADINQVEWCCFIRA